jgi:hypothetical protein
MIVPVLVNLIIIPQYACKVVELPLRTYLSKGCLKACLFSLPLAAALLGAVRIVPLNTWRALGAVSLCGAVVYLLTLASVAWISSRFRRFWFSLDTLTFIEKSLLKKAKAAEVGSPLAAGLFEELDRNAEATAWN